MSALPTTPGGLLEAGAAELGLELISDQRDSLLAYVELLVKWNRVYNLTAVRDHNQMISRHLLDSLTILPFLHGQSLIDIGSGAGLPGIPIAITRPDVQCFLLDSNVKKTRFIQQVITELSLPNVEVVHTRVENSTLAVADTVVSRAFSSPLDIIDKAGHLCADSGILLFMLGHTDGLLDDLPKAYRLSSLHSVTVPFQSATRHIAVCRHNDQHND